MPCIPLTGHKKTTEKREGRGGYSRKERDIQETMEEKRGGIRPPYIKKGSDRKEVSGGGGGSTKGMKCLIHHCFSCSPDL